MAFQSISGNPPLIKGQAYTHYFFQVSGVTPQPLGALGISTYSIHQISKDGSAFTNLTNSPVEIGNGFYKIDLTSSETNADTILIYLRYASSVTISEPIILYPLAPSGGASASDIWSYSTRGLTEDVTVSGDSGATADEVKTIVRKLLLALGGK